MPDTQCAQGSLLCKLTSPPEDAQAPDTAAAFALCRPIRTQAGPPFMPVRMHLKYLQCVRKICYQLWLLQAKRGTCRVIAQLSAGPLTSTAAEESAE